MSLAYGIVTFIFALCVFVVLYSYIGYPVLVWVLSRVFRRKEEPPADDDAKLPKVSLFVAAYNEEAMIEKRIINALELDYPKDKLQIVIGSDGSADKTAEIVRRYEDRGVKLLDYPQRRGKATVLNDSFKQLEGDIVVLSDANTFTEPPAVRHLVRWFADPTIGCVCGRLVLMDAKMGRNVDSLYWKYETFLKKCESRLGALLGSNGAIYAIRRELFEPIPNDTIVDDFVIPLLAKLRSDCRIIYDAQAVALEETAPDVLAEFKRRSRIGAGGFQAIGMLWRLLNPAHGWVAPAFFSHKILRWLCPFAMIGLIVTNLLLIAEPFYMLTFAAQVLFYGASLAGPYIPGRNVLVKPLRVATMFTSMNAALLVGFWKWLKGNQKSTWHRTVRSNEISQSAR